MPHRSEQTRFSSTTGAVLATAGVAIGLGNIWRFPYMMGKYGGSAFLVVYIVLIIAFGVPALMAEWALGRHTRCGPASAFRQASMPGGSWFSGLLLVTVLMAASYYGVVLAWVLGESTVFIVHFSGVSSAHVWRAQGASYAIQMIYIAGTVLLGCGIIRMGIRRGIERISMIGLPIFFLLFLVLIIRVLTLDDAIGGLKQFIVPRLDDLTPQTPLAAMGQAFFSLGLGGTFMVMYGSYMRRDVNLLRAAMHTTIADLAAALMAGLIIVPAVFALDKNLAGGPTLLFAVMPEVFNEMPLGYGFGAAFFLSVFFVGLLSLIAAYEVLVSALEKRTEWTRTTCIIIVFISQVVLSIPAIVFDSYIEISDLIWGTTMQPVGSALAIIALIWCVGRSRALEQFSQPDKRFISSFLIVWLKYVLPIGIAVMLVYGWFGSLE